MHIEKHRVNWTIRMDLPLQFILMRKLTFEPYLSNLIVPGNYVAKIIVSKYLYPHGKYVKTISTKCTMTLKLACKSESQHGDENFQKIIK